MSRKIALRLTRGIYYVVCKGQRHQPLFFSNADFKVYLSLCEAKLSENSISLYAYVLMRTEAHFLVKTGGAPLKIFLHDLNTAYAMYFNGSRDLSGHVFQDRCDVYLVNDNRYLKNIISRIHLMPLSEGYVDDPDDYDFSSSAYYSSGKKSIHALKFCRCFYSREKYNSVKMTLPPDFPIHENTVGTPEQYVRLQKRRIGEGIRAGRDRRGLDDKFSEILCASLTDEGISMGAFLNMKYTRAVDKRRKLARILRLLHSGGFSLRKISERTGYSRSFISKILKEN